MDTPIPASLPAALTDRFISAFFASIGDIMVQIEMRFSHRLDPKRLTQALQLVLDAEPILGCRFVIDAGNAHWQRLAQTERGNLKIFTNATSYQSYLSETIDSAAGPALQAALWQAGDGDTLLLKAVHEAADAGGLKDIAYLIAWIYRKLTLNPDYRPQPNTRGSREVDQVMRRIPRHSFFRIWLNALAEAFALIRHRACHNPFTSVDHDQGRQYLRRQISAERVARIGWDCKSHLRCAMTIDLRQWYLPNAQAQAVCNLSSMEICNLGADPGSSFEDTLHKIVAFTTRRKRSWIGLNLYAGLLRLMSGWSFQRMQHAFMQQHLKDQKNHAIFPIFTNLGPIDPQRLVFEQKPADVWVVVPAAFPPYFGIGLSGYEGSLTICAAAFPGSREVVDAILDYMLAELPD